MARRHLRSAIAAIAREGQQAIPQPTNRQLSRTETEMLTIPPDGKTPDRPTVLGKPNGDDPIQVYATGLYMGIMKGETRWVTGTGVADGLDGGVIVLLGTLLEDYLPPDATVYDVPPNDGPPFEITVDAVDAIREGGWTEPIPEATEADRQLAEMSKAQLVTLAQEVGLEGRSAMDKSELYEHLRRHPDVADFLG